ncbi:MAG: hypothetical protein Q9P14_11190 [candidate division KSB1 bacterium]|nr:hypothetical protein [candidate division KSB1 bacterium]
MTLNPGDNVSGRTIQVTPQQTADTTPPTPPRNVRARKLGN